MIINKHQQGVSLMPALLVVGAGVSAALHVWKLPPALPILQQSFELTLTQVGWLVAVFQLAGLFLGVLFGVFVQHIGVGRSIILGLILLSCASFLGALITNLVGLLIFRVVEGFALLLVTMSAPSLVQQLAPVGKRAFLIALWGAYFPLASLLALLFGSLLLHYLPWFGLWIVTGGLSLIMALILWRQLTLLSLFENLAPQSWAQEKCLIKGTLSSISPWLLSITFALYSSQWMAVLAFLPILYYDIGVVGIHMGMLAAFISGVNIFGNLLAGRLLQRGATPQLLLSCVFIIMLLTAFAAFGMGLTVWQQFVVIALFSGLSGIIPATLFNLALQVAPTPAAIPMVIGLQQQWISLGQFLGPILTALVVNAYGWGALWYLTGFWALLGLITGRWLCRTIKDEKPHCNL